MDSQAASERLDGAAPKVRLWWKVSFRMGTLVKLALWLKRLNPDQEHTVDQRVRVIVYRETTGIETRNSACENKSSSDQEDVTTVMRADTRAAIDRAVVVLGFAKEIRHCSDVQKCLCGAHNDRGDGVKQAPGGQVRQHR